MLRKERGDKLEKKTKNKNDNRENKSKSMLTAWPVSIFYVFKSKVKRRRTTFSRQTVLSQETICFSFFPHTELCDCRATIGEVITIIII